MIAGDSWSKVLEIVVDSEAAACKIKLLMLS